jgi:hypothetical protein
MMAALMDSSMDEKMVAEKVSQSVAGLEREKAADSADEMGAYKFVTNN